MNKYNGQYIDHPYLFAPGGESIMTSGKSTFFMCVTILLSVASFIVYSKDQNRYAIFPQDKSIFVFDKKNATINYCTAQSCQLITPHVMAEENKNVVPGLPSQAALIQQAPSFSSLQQIAATPEVTVTAQLQQLVQGAPAAVAIASAPATPLAAAIAAPPPSAAVQPVAAAAPIPAAHA